MDKVNRGDLSFFVALINGDGVKINREFSLFYKLHKGLKWWVTLQNVFIDQRYKTALEASYCVAFKTSNANIFNVKALSSILIEPVFFQSLQKKGKEFKVNIFLFLFPTEKRRKGLFFKTVHICINKDQKNCKRLIVKVVKIEFLYF